MTEQTIMTVEEVAEYLRVSERTVYEWAQKGEIPAGKLGSVWRFKRSDVQDWVENRLGGKREGAGVALDRLSELLPPERILLKERATKVEALTALVDCLAQMPCVTNRDALAAAVAEREKLMSTGIGLGIAVPHVRVAWLDRIIMAACVVREPIEDYESLDGQPVQMIFMIAAGSKQHSEYLRILAELTGLLKGHDLRERLLSASEPNEFYGILMGRAH